jgi:Uma2 family endonuclease
MGQPAEKQSRATYADYLAVPAPQRAEIIDGQLYVFPRPAPPHAFTAQQIAYELEGPFGHRRRGGPGGWWILPEPELHLVDEEPVSPDLAGWRLERMAALPTTAYFALAPDWVCEVLSKSTEAYDREIKMPLYAAHGVQHAWLVDPMAKTLEVYTLEGKRWSLPVYYQGSTRARIAPFAEVELDLAGLWAPR